MANPTFELRITPFDPPPGAYTGGVEGPIVKTQTFTDGDLDNQTRILTHLDVSIGASGTSGLDFVSDVDRYGVAAASTDVVLFYVEHKAASTASSIHLQPNAVNGWSSFLNVGGTLTLKPGDFILMGAFKAGNQAVSGSSKAFDIVNDDGANAALVIIQIWNRK